MKHPYKEFEKTAVWKVLDRGVKELQANGDIEERTARPYIVGYLTKLLRDSGALAEPTDPAETGAGNGL